jgi:hypothetical protein
VEEAVLSSHQLGGRERTRKGQSFWGLTQCLETSHMLCLLTLPPLPSNANLGSKALISTQGGGQSWGTSKVQTTEHLSFQILHSDVTCWHQRRTQFLSVPRFGCWERCSGVRRGSAWRWLHTHAPGLSPSLAMALHNPNIASSFVILCTDTLDSQPRI